METLELQQPSALPDGQLSDYELERGKPIPSKNHSIAQAALIFALKSAYRQEYSILSESSVTLNGDKHTPDVTIFPKILIDWERDEISFFEPPLTTIEILSPIQVLENLLDKAEDYFSGGVKSCWIVLPRLKTILVMQANRLKTYFQIGETLTDPATGITLQVSDILRNK